MNRKHLLIGSGVVTTLIAIIILVVSLNLRNEPTEEAESFCDAFPNAVFCVEDDPSEMEIAADMIVTLMVHYPNVMSESFCTNYFSGNLRTYCLDDPSVLVPPDFDNVSTNIEVVRIGEGIYDIRTKYSNYVPAYTFRLALNNMDGAYHISGLSYFDIPATVNLGLTDEAIDTFMQAMFAASQDPEDTFCEDYFTWMAKSVCTENPDEFIENPEVTENYIITNIATNRYEYTVNNVEDTLTLQYTVLFEDVEGVTRISKIDVIEVEEEATE